MSELGGAGPEKKTLIFNTEQGFAWKGLSPDLEPAMLPVDAPQQLVNIRLSAGELDGRGGQKLLCTHACPLTGIYDFFTEVAGGTGPA